MIALAVVVLWLVGSAVFATCLSVAAARARRHVTVNAPVGYRVVPAAPRSAA